ncbi:MAG: cytokinesis protein 3 [Sclerophora amabilis]|nr:MAG: cytokinesis protein 3 [Sclerophora amabilis]
MVPAPSGLPTRFPCWCRAIYSWGGETKRDLGFIEGDLIECLNAGDGSWWTGRLYRDKRIIGLFPSNFVRILDSSFQPNSRATSPLPPAQNGAGSMSRASSPNPMNGASRGPSPQPQKTPSKGFRKPFQAYARASSPNPAAVARDADATSRGPSPNSSNHQRQHSYRSSPERHNSYNARTPASRNGQASRAASPDFYHDTGSSPPPPAPPPHRVLYAPRGGPSPAPAFSDNHAHSNGHTISRQPSPVAHSPGGTGLTPSPLRDAMEDVMSSLHDMGASQASPTPQRSPSHLDPWSPEAFEIPYVQSPSRRKARPRSSLGIGKDEFDENGNTLASNDVQALDYDTADEPPQLENYVKRMESRLRQIQQPEMGPPDELFLPDETNRRKTGIPPAVPPKHSNPAGRPQSSLERNTAGSGSTRSSRILKNRKSAFELGKGVLGRTTTTKSSATSASSDIHSTITGSSNSTQITSQSIMSGHSAGGFSATSAGSLARRRGYSGVANMRPMSVLETSRNGLQGINGGRTSFADGRPQTPLTGVTFHSSHDSNYGKEQPEWAGSVAQPGGVFGGLAAPKPKKSGFFKKILDSAKTGAASARSSISAGQAVPPQPPPKSMLPQGVTAISSGNPAREMGLGGGSGGDWVQVRRDVNRSNSLSKNERVERQERCQMMDYPVVNPVDILLESTEGDEGVDGLAIQEPENFQAVNMTLVDKSARFINSLPPMTNPVSLAQGYVCRPYRSDVQRLRAIFTWVSEKIAWEEDFEGAVDSRRVIHTKRGCSEEVSVLVMEMCVAVGIRAEVVRGYLKTPGEQLEVDVLPHPNHWWNNVVVEGQWRTMDCSLASPTNPKRSQYSSAGTQVAESWWFLARPSESCYTHVPLIPQQQHICPPLPHDVLMALPSACPPYFKHQLQMIDYDTSLVRIEELEQVHVHVTVPSDLECVAEVEARAFTRDADGDFFESGEIVRKRALAQAEWVGGQKRYTIKALLPGDEGQGILKVYAGKRGLMHSIKDNPHPLAFALPIIHAGNNPPYEFLTRHPTPHAQRHDLYVAQPQCARLAVNNTFVFAVRQHPSSLSSAPLNPGGASPIPFARPSSAMSMSNSSASGTGSSTGPNPTKAAKLAIQAPSGKILRLMRKSDHMISTSGPGGGEAGDGGVWETIIKCGERGVWRGLVLADRTARWCVFAEWDCV